MVTGSVANRAEPIKSLSGISHEILVFDDRLVIRPTSLMTRLFQEDQIIQMDEIEEVRLYNSRFWTKGWIQLVIIARNKKSTGVLFSLRQDRQAEELKATITEIKSRREVVPYLKTLTP